jgi:oligopeptide transport system ATP-binding protein
MNAGTAPNAGAAPPSAGAAPSAGVAENAGVAGADLLLRVSQLRVDFGARAALSDVSFDLFAGETLGLVGESGSGKSTLARAILRLIRASGGSAVWRGTDLLTCAPAALRALRRDLQIVFQDPLASLDPRMTVGETIAEPLRIFEPGLNGAARSGRIGAMLQRVGLDAGMMGRYPHEFSGGQCQRIGIARAMILSPKLLICDEPVSSLDVSIQGQIVNLLLDLQRDAGTAMLFISHNLAVVRHLSHRILVMYSGRLVEIAPRDALFAAPLHPYTRALLAAVPSLTPVRDGAGGGAAGGVSGPPRRLPTAEPLPRNESTSAVTPLPESGCAFRDRCPYAVAVCVTAVPPLEEVAAGHWAACHRSRELISQ